MPERAPSGTVGKRLRAGRRLGRPHPPRLAQADLQTRHHRHRVPGREAQPQDRRQGLGRVDVQPRHVHAARAPPAEGPRQHERLLQGTELRHVQDRGQVRRLGRGVEEADGLLHRQRHEHQGEDAPARPRRSTSYIEEERQGLAARIRRRLLPVRRRARATRPAAGCTGRTAPTSRYERPARPVLHRAGGRHR